MPPVPSFWCRECPPGPTCVSPILPCSLAPPGCGPHPPRCSHGAMLVLLPRRWVGAPTALGHPVVHSLLCACSGGARPVALQPSPAAAGWSGACPGTPCGVMGKQGVVPAVGTAGRQLSGVWMQRACLGWQQLGVACIPPSAVPSIVGACVSGRRVLCGCCCTWRGCGAAAPAAGALPLAMGSNPPCAGV